MKKMLNRMGMLGRLGLGAAALAALSACVAPAPYYQQTSTYPYEPAPSYPVVGTPVPQVSYGRVVNIEVLQTQASGGPQSGVGAVTGGVVGGVLGHQVGGGSGKAAATVLGVVGGALLGNAIEANTRSPRVYQSTATASFPAARTTTSCWWTSVPRVSTARKPRTRSTKPASPSTRTASPSTPAAR